MKSTSVNSIRLQTALREPLLHFLILGAAIFGVDQWRNAGSETASDIVVTAKVQQEAKAIFEAGMKREPEKYNHDITVEANYELFQERRIAYSNQIAKVLNLVEKKFGHRDLYCYGVDEAGPDTVRR